jgi:hypothetical protein
VSGTLIGQSDDPTRGVQQSFAYRAEVTNLVSGNGSYTIAGSPQARPPANFAVSDSEGRAWW